MKEERVFKKLRIICLENTWIAKTRITIRATGTQAKEKRGVDQQRK